MPLQKPPFIADVQCRVHGVWTSFPPRQRGAGRDGMSWITYSFYGVKPGKYLIRAHFTGTNYNVAGYSAARLSLRSGEPVLTGQSTGGVGM